MRGAGRPGGTLELSLAVRLLLVSTFEVIPDLVPKMSPLDDAPTRSSCELP